MDSIREETKTVSSNVAASGSDNVPSVTSRSIDAKTPVGETKREPGQVEDDDGNVCELSYVAPLGHGSYGEVAKMKTGDGKEVAVKKLALLDEKNDIMESSAVRESNACAQSLSLRETKWDSEKHSEDKKHMVWTKCAPLGGPYIEESGYIFFRCEPDTDQPDMSPDREAKTLYFENQVSDIGDLGKFLRSVSLAKRTEPDKRTKAEIKLALVDADVMLALAFDILCGLALLDRNKFMNGDLKPENCLVFECSPGQYRLKTSDMGSVRFSGTTLLNSLSTLWYRSPEGYLGGDITGSDGKRRVQGVMETIQSDMFSVGVMLHQMFGTLVEKATRGNEFPFRLHEKDEAFFAELWDRTHQGDRKVFSKSGAAAVWPETIVKYMTDEKKQAADPPIKEPFRHLDDGSVGPGKFWPNKWVRNIYRDCCTWDPDQRPDPLKLMQKFIGKSNTLLPYYGSVTAARLVAYTKELEIVNEMRTNAYKRQLAETSVKSSPFYNVMQRAIYKAVYCHLSQYVNADLGRWGDLSMVALQRLLNVSPGCVRKWAPLMETVMKPKTSTPALREEGAACTIGYAVAYLVASLMGWKMAIASKGEYAYFPRIFGEVVGTDLYTTKTGQRIVYQFQQCIWLELKWKLLEWN